MVRIISRNNPTSYLDVLSRALSATAIVFILLVSGSGSALARTWYIKADGSGDAPTIQDGVDAASDGDVILVGAGDYSATSTIDIGGTATTVCVSIGKNIKLVSENGSQTTTIGNAAANIVIYVHDVGQNVEINGFQIHTTFSGYFCVANAVAPTAPLPSFYRRGIRCQNASPIIKNNIVENGIAIELLASPAAVLQNEVRLASYGIVCSDGSDASLGQNVIHTCAFAIATWSSSPTIVDNEMYDGCTGVQCLVAGSPTVTRNVIHDYENYGVVAEVPLTLEENRVLRTWIAAELSNIVGTCEVRGNICVYQSTAFNLSDDDRATIVIETNTICSVGLAIACQRGSSPTIARNIIFGASTGIWCALSSFPVISCNDVMATRRYVGDCGDQTGTNGNISIDPQFCGVPNSDNYALQSDSPCAPGHHPDGSNCGRIGAQDVACGPLATVAKTWGAIKAMYRR